jgi:hypothetical protein
MDEKLRRSISIQVPSAALKTTHPELNSSIAKKHDSEAPPSATAKKKKPRLSGVKVAIGRFQGDRGV